MHLRLPFNIKSPTFCRSYIVPWIRFAGLRLGYNLALLRFPLPLIVLPIIASAFTQDREIGIAEISIINAQVVCSLSGGIYNVQLLQGHNNDQGSFNLKKTHRIAASFCIISRETGHCAYDCVSTDQHVITTIPSAEGLYYQ